MIEWWGPIIWEYYAGTEGNGMTVVDSHAWLTHKGTVGKAVVGRLKICGPGGEDLPAGEVGTIYFADGNPFEYHNDPQKTAESHNAQGWSTLGDIGHVDTEGYLYLTDRKAHMIISGGVNIYPQECENVLVTIRRSWTPRSSGSRTRSSARRSRPSFNCATCAKPARRWKRNCSRSAARTCRRSNARARWTSKRSCLAIPPESCTNACCVIATGRGEAIS